MDTLKYICEKYNIDISKPSPFYLPIGRFKDIPRLFHDLGFKIGAEIGVYRGSYSRSLLTYCPGLKLYGIDSWADYRGYENYEPNDILDAYAKAQESVKGFDCKLIKGWSNEVVRQFDDESLNFVFIDGDHTYEHVVEDIALWSKKVRKGGIVYGHDFDDLSNNKKKWEKINVINAVYGWTKSYKIHPWFVITKNKNRSWMYVK